MGGYQDPRNILWQNLPVAAPAPVAVAPAPVAAPSDGCGCPPSALDVQLKIFDDGGGGPNLRHICLSDTPKPGVYWRVLQVDAMDTDTNAQSLTFFLTPPGFSDTTLTFNTVSPDFFLSLRNTIRLGAGHDIPNTSDLTNVSSQGSSPASMLGMNPVIVPPGWKIGVAETNSILSGTAHHLILRVLFVEVAIGVPILGD
jgi:hypothetical protein